MPVQNMLSIQCLLEGSKYGMALLLHNLYWEVSQEYTFLVELPKYLFQSLIGK